MELNASHDGSLRSLRSIVVIVLTAICIFMVMWQRESTEMLTNAENYVDETHRISDRFFLKDEYARQRDLSQPGLKKGDWNVRHKLRWAYKAVEVTVYKAVADYGSAKLLRYTSLLHYVGIFILTHVFCLLILQRELGRLEITHFLISGLAFVGFISAIFHVTGWQEDYTSIEMLAIAVAIYAGQKKKIWLLIVAIVLAVSNRESGLAVALIYPLLNPERLRNWWLPLVVAIGVFGILNYDLLLQSELYRLEQFIITNKTKYITILNFYRFPVGQWGAGFLSYIAFVAPALILIKECLPINEGRRYWGIAALYIVIILIGSSLTNSFLFLMLLPIYFLIMGLVLGNKAA
jgi:hypothetical protein